MDAVPSSSCWRFSLRLFRLAMCDYRRQNTIIPLLDNQNRALICTHTIISIYIYIYLFIYIYIHMLYSVHIHIYIYIMCPINAADISKYSTPLKTNINPWSNGPCPRAVHLPPNPDGFLGSKVLRKLKRKSYLFIAIPWENHGNILRIMGIISDKTNRIHHGYSIGIIMGISSKIEDSRGTFFDSDGNWGQWATGPTSGSQRSTHWTLKSWRIPQKSSHSSP